MAALRRAYRLAIEQERITRAPVIKLLPEHNERQGFIDPATFDLQLVASIVGGLLWDQVGHTAVFFYGAIFAVLGSIAMVLLVPGEHGREGSGRLTQSSDGE